MADFGNTIIRPNGDELIQRMPEQMTIELNSKNALQINDDRDWLRLRPFLNSLFLKYGTFSIEVSRI